MVEAVKEAWEEMVQWLPEAMVDKIFHLLVIWEPEEMAEMVAMAVTVVMVDGDMEIYLMALTDAGKHMAYADMEGVLVNQDNMVAAQAVKVLTGALLLSEH